MRHETVTVDRPGIDWKGLGYLVSIVSVLLLGAVAWPTDGEPEWYKPMLLAGILTAILGMAFRYKAHLDQRKELKETEAKVEERAR